MGTIASSVPTVAVPLDSRCALGSTACSNVRCPSPTQEPLLHTRFSAPSKPAWEKGDLEKRESPCQHVGCQGAVGELVLVPQYCTLQLTGTVLRSAMVRLTGSGLAFGLGDRNRKSNTVVVLRIEFCIQLPCPIFFFSKKVRKYIVNWYPLPL